MFDLVPANDNFHIDANLVDAVQTTMAHEEEIQEITTALRRKLALLRREQIRRHG